MVATGATVERLRLFDRIRLDLSKLPSRFPYLLITPQYNVERALEERAVSQGARIVRGAELTTIARNDDQVTLTFTDGHGATADYVVGTDGAHSAVRKAVEMPFPGQAPDHPR
ncbi:FAD-dependent monooxygenase [Actinoplanes sp. CA-015351]|uniref:FAD-dependent monooxygenase n=1 Tax=Actinoplanes sp. CA-015351 TaxID=3239897 RepID=UPI003D952A45